MNYYKKITTSPRSVQGKNLPPFVWKGTIGKRSHNSVVQRVENKTGTCDYLGHPVPLLEGEISKQESYVSKGDLFGGLRQNASLGLSLSIQFMYL